MSALLPLDTLAATIKTRIAKGDKAATDSDNHYLAAGLHLIEAKKRIESMPALTWAAFLEDRCGVRRRRADELIAVAEGRTTFEKVRAAKAESMRRTRRERAKESAPRGAQPSSRTEGSLARALGEFDALNRSDRAKFLDSRGLVVAPVSASDDFLHRDAA